MTAPDTASVLPGLPAPEPKVPPAAVLAEVLAAAPGDLCALVRNLPEGRRQALVEKALASALQAEIRAALKPAVAGALAAEVPGRVRAALDRVAGNVGWGETLPDLAQRRLRSEIESAVRERAATLAAQILDRVCVVPAAEAGAGDGKVKP